MSDYVEDIGDGWKVTVRKTFEEVESLRHIWHQMQSRELQPVPNADMDWYLSVLRSRKQQMQPCVMLFCQHGEPAAMIIARLEKLKFESKIGYKVVFKPSLRCLTVVYGGILGNPDENTCDVLIRYLQSFLRIGSADMIFFNEMRIETLFYRLARRVPNSLCRGFFPNVHIHRSQSIPKNIEAFYQALSKKHRAKMRRVLRKLEKEHTGEVNVVKYDSPHDIESLAKAVSVISNKTYQYAMGCGFKDDLSNRYLMERSAEFGMLRGYVLFVGGYPCAFQLSTFYRNTYFLDKIGFDPAWKTWNVGTALFIKALEDMCSCGDAGTLDFLFGDADYKRHYSDKHWSEASIYIFAPRLYPVVVNLVDSSIRGVSLGLAWVAQKSGLINKIKRRWRDKLQQKNKKNITGR